MNFWVHVAMSASVALPAAAAALRLKKIEGDYLPFFLLLWLGAVHNIVKPILIYQWEGHAVSSNVFALLQALLLTWQFHKWDLFARRPWGYPLLQAGLVVLWVVSTIAWEHPYGFNTYFILYSSLALMLMGIAEQSVQIVWGGGKHLRNPVFLITLGMVLFFAAKSLNEIFWHYGLSLAGTFQRKVSVMLSCVNLATNFLYLIAILWIPRKLPSTMYS